MSRLDPATSSQPGPAGISAPRTILEADASDVLGGLRANFALPEGRIYLDGNSLGVRPRATRERLIECLDVEWGEDLITSWNRHDWIGAPQRVGDKVARLIGANPGEVVVADSTSVNLFKLLMAALDARPGRRTILSEPGNFPTDLYVAQGAARLLGREVRTVPAEQIVSAVDADTAVVLLTHVHYKTGRKLDMSALTAAAHAQGALVLWDLSHSAGAVEVDLNGAGADLAVGCGYKYLNGGPGAPAFLFAAQRHHAALQTPLQGWMGHATPFDFVDAYAPEPGVERFLCGTPPILGMTALEVGVDLMLRAQPAQVAAKSQALVDLFIREVEAACPDLRLVTPREPARRGSHVSFAHPHAYEICQALIARGVIGDFRAPDVLRFGMTPLYLSFEDVWRAAGILAEVMGTQAWRSPAHAVRHAVT